MPTGKLPPQAAPARMRRTNSSQKLGHHGGEERRHRKQQQARDHHPRLAEGVRHRAKHRLRQAVGGEGRGQQRGGRRRDREIRRDLRHHRVDRAHAQRGGEDQEADDVERPVHELRRRNVREQTTPTPSTTKAPKKDRRLRPAMRKAEAVHNRADGLAEIERRRMQRGRRAARGLRQVGDVHLDAGVQQVEAKPEGAIDRDLDLPGEVQRDQSEARSPAMVPPISIRRRSGTARTR